MRLQMFRNNTTIDSGKNPMVQRAYQASAPSSFRLVEAETRLSDVRTVERYLPDILGRAMARGWIDSEFRRALVADPKRLLETYGVHLPPSIVIRVETDAGERERFVVYKMHTGKAPQRLLYLQLVLRAGR